MFEAVKTAESWLKSTRFWLLALSAALLLFLSQVPLATAQGNSTSQRLEAIRQRMEKGQALYLTKDYAGAAQIFEDGYKAYPYSAFLFNAGVCFQKLGDLDRALSKFREYLRVDPSAPDAGKVKERIEALEAAKAEQAAQAAVVDAGEMGDAGEEAGVDEAGVPIEAGAPVEAGAPAPIIAQDDATAMKSLVVIETEPEGAPLKLYQRVDDKAPPFVAGSANPGWQEVASTRAPASLTLAIGRYHVVVEKFRDFNQSETDIDVAPGHVLQFKANLSQGAFMSFLRVSANVQGAYVYLDDPKKTRPYWGLTPHAELVGYGKHQVLIEAPGFEPLATTVELSHGEQKELEVKLVRVGYGIVRIHSNAAQIKVAIDEKPRGVWSSGEPPLDIQVPSGQHKLTVTSEGRKDFEGLIEVPRGQVLPVHATMIQKYPRGAAWTQAIVGGAVIGASVWAGLESNKLHDELEEDRQKGVLEDTDSRATRGRWFAVGADAGFVVGTALLGLATYNFIRDPLPDSSTQVETPVEFEDPKKTRPVASRPTPRPREKVARKPELEVAPFVGSSSGGVVVGGSF